MKLYSRALAIAGFWLCLGPSHAAELDTMAQRMLPCATCHGAQGQATADGYYPRIAGKPAGYLYEQLLNFRDGQRQHAGMSYFLDRQRDAYLQQMAEHFAAQELPYPAPLATKSSAASLARGEVLVRKGDALRKVPACNACHGERLTGLQPAVPGLLGLPFDYITAQLGGWLVGVRHARAPDCMADIVKALAPGDIEVVAAWLAAQPVPLDAKAPRGEISTDRHCGSLEPRQ